MLFARERFRVSSERNNREVSAWRVRERERERKLGLVCCEFGNDTVRFMDVRMRVTLIFFFFLEIIVNIT